MTAVRTRRALLEVCVDSLSSALAARDGGADRIELCADLEAGGLTPAHPLVEEVVQAVEIPVHVMVRPGAGGFAYSESEYELMRETVVDFRLLGCAGIVTGILTEERTPDARRTAELVRLAGGMEVTFHRAIDLTPDIEAAAQLIAGTGVRRILTSGSAEEAAAGAGVIARLVARCDALSVIAAGGITPENAGVILRSTGVRELHAWRGVSVMIPPDAGTGATEVGALRGRGGRRDVDARLVGLMKRAMENFGQDS